ncbi:MAG: hypothetical protein L0Y72_17140 [Gemmataceae bacterium]|nr:hypothetical protein [Gemmataceae bacterium]
MCRDRYCRVLAAVVLFVFIAAASAQSPLDKLDPSKIPALERFDWHPKELVGILGEHRGRHGHAVYAVAFHPDGKRVASAGANGIIRLWDAKTLRQEVMWGAHGSGASGLAFFPDGKTLASCGYDGRVVLWDLTMTPPKLKSFAQEGSAGLYAVAVTPKADLVAVAGADTTIYVWDVTDEGLKKRPALQSHTGAVHGLDFAADGKTLASASADETIRLWTVAKDSIRERESLRGHTKSVLCVAYAPDGTLVSGGIDQFVRLWDVSGKQARPKGILQGKNGYIYSIAFGPKASKLFATGNSDNTILLWNFGPPPVLKAVLQGHVNVVQSVALPSKGTATTLISGGADWTVRSWDIAAAKPRERAVPKGPLGHVYGLDFSPDGKLAATGGYERVLRLWEFGGPEAKERNPYTKDPLLVHSVVWSPKGKTLAYAGQDIAVRLFDPEARFESKRLAGHPSHVTFMAYSQDARRLVTASKEEIRVFDVDKGKELQAFKGHTKYVSGVAFSPDGQRVLSGAGGYKLNKDGKIMYAKGLPVYEDCTVRLWDVESGKELWQFKDIADPVLSVAMAPGGKQFYAGAQDSMLRQWKCEGDAPSAFSKHNPGRGYVYHTAYSPDGRWLVIVGSDGNVALLEAATGKTVRHWLFPELRYRAFFAPDSRHLAVPVATGAVYILRLEGHY